MPITCNLLFKVKIVVAVLLLFGCASTEYGKVQSSKELQSTIFPELIGSFKELSSREFAGRETGSQGNKKAQNFIENAMSSAGILPFKNSFSHPFSFKKQHKQWSATNIIGYIPSNTTGCKHIIVLTAHYDHLGQSESGYTYFGADDNASGTAALLAISRRLNNERVNHNFVILFTDAEELNLKGAKAFVRMNPDVVDQTIININMDMLSGSSEIKKLHYLSHGLGKIPSFNQEKFRDKLREQSINIKKITNGFSIMSNKTKLKWLKASDHGVFHKKGIPVLYFGVGIHKNYHTQRDSFQNANKTMLISATESIYNVIKFVDQEIKNIKQ